MRQQTMLLAILMRL